MSTVHATCVAIDGIGVLLRGGSGTGKSDLALRLIDEGALLVADDQVALEAARGRLMARGPSAIAGLLEVRGLGPMPVASTAAAPVTLVVDLAPADRIERCPEPRFDRIEGIDLPVVEIDASAPSAAARVRLAARAAAGARGPWPVAAARAERP
jgi:serine kinase of HPr protein (carbohydrate metabolism regulator)